MLRNCLKVALCGLIGLSINGCTSTRPLLSVVDRSGRSVESADVKIKAEPIVEYQISRVIARTLSNYIQNPQDYIITIKVTEHSSSALYTQKQVAKEQLRMAASINIYDKDYNEIGSKLVDAFSTYEVCDELPFSVSSSKTQARNTVTQELANSIVFAIVSIIKER